MPRRKYNHNIDSGSFADIAFLLLIFFMVVTTFNKTYQIEMNLPSNKTSKAKGVIAKDRILNILLNDHSQILINDRIVQKTESFSLREELNAILSRQKQLVIKIGMHPHTPYNNYLRVLSQIKKDKKVILDELALKLYAKKIEQLTLSEKQIVKERTKFRIIETEL